MKLSDWTDVKFFVLHPVPYPCWTVYVGMLPLGVTITTRIIICLYTRGSRLTFIFHCYLVGEHPQIYDGHGFCFLQCRKVNSMFC